LRGKATSEDFVRASLPPGNFHWTKIRTENRTIELREAVERYTSWVYVCAGRNASAVAQTPLEFFKMPGLEGRAERMAWNRLGYRSNGVETKRLGELKQIPWLKSRQRKALEDVEEVSDHPFLTLFEQVNPHENGFEMIEKLVLFLELCGNSFLFLAKNELGIPVQLWHMPPQWTKIVPDPVEFIKEYRYGPIEPRVPFEKADVVHFKYPNPKDQFLGWGPLQAAMDPVETSTFYHRYEQTLLENYARPDFILSTDLSLNQTQIDGIKGQWNKLFRGVKNAGKVAVLEAGLKPVTFNFTPREMAFLQGRQMSRDEIAAAFGVPKSLIETKDVNRSNADTGEYCYAKYTILPRIRRIEQKINESIVWPYFGDQYFAAFCNPVADDKEYRLKEIENHLKYGLSSINEERERENMEPADWGEGDPRPKQQAVGGKPGEGEPGRVYPLEEPMMQPGEGEEPQKGLSLKGSNGHHKSRLFLDE
jgi:HK97 family phage portal protein